MIPSPPETRASLILRLPDPADVAAWDEFVALYGPLVFRLARRQGLGPDDADDVVQEVFAAVAQSVARWLQRKDRGKFRAWLLRIARNLAINQLTRRATRSLGLDGAEGERLLAGAPDVANDHGALSSAFDLEYRREVFHRAAAEVRECVSAATWDAFWMTHVENQPIEQVAARLGVTVGKVYIARSRVMARLKNVVRRFEATE